MKKIFYSLFLLFFLFGLGSSMHGQEKTAKPFMKIIVEDGKVVKTIPLDKNGNPDLASPQPPRVDEKATSAESLDMTGNHKTILNSGGGQNTSVSRDENAIYTPDRVMMPPQVQDPKKSLVKHAVSLQEEPVIETEEVIEKGQSLPVTRSVTSAVFDPSNANVRYIQDDAKDVKQNYVSQDIQPEAGWEVIMSNDFESAIFPATPWNCYSSGAADAYWDDQAYRANSGSWSLYCADNGTNFVSAPGPYPTDMNAWAVYGPFDLSDATTAWLDFDLWLQAETNYDYFRYMVSVDGVNFYGYSETGNTGGLWEGRSLDLGAVPTLGNVSGNDEVYFALVFESDYIISYEGAYVDDVVLWKYAHDMDLYSTNIYLDLDTWAAGETVTGGLREVNMGTDAAPAHYSRLYMSTNNIISTGDYQLGGDLYFSSIAAGGDQTVSGHTFSAPDVASGSYYVGNIVDVYNYAHETNESNNYAVRGGQVLYPDVDLYWTNLAVTTNTWTGGLSVTGTLTEANGGTQLAGAHYTRLYLSTNDIVSSGDTQLGGDLYFPSVAAGGVTIVAETFSAPAWTTGTYYMGAIVDFYGDVVESNEDNNAYVRGGPIYYDPDVDLYSTNIYLSTDVWEVGSAVTADLREVNGGIDASGAHYSRLYLSADATVSTGDVQLGGDLYFSSIAGGGDQTVSGHSFVAPDVTDGSYWVGNIVDIYDDVVETDEANNYAMRSGQVTSSHPVYVDLLWTSLSLSSTTWVTGDMVTAGLTVLNDEAGTADPSHSRIYLSDNTTIGNSDTQLGGDISFGSIVGGASSTQNLTFAVPSATAGTYYVGAIVDYYDAVVENDESNNANHRSGTVSVVDQSFTISATVQPAGSGTVAGAGSYIINQTATLVATATTGFEFVNWTEAAVVVSSAQSYSFNVTADRSLVANFVPITLTVSTDVNPAASGTATGGGSYAYGTSASLSASPAAGYEFVNWTIDAVVVSTSPDYTFTVYENTVAVANFGAATYTVTLVADPADRGSVTGGGDFLYGEVANVAAIEGDGYEFKFWADLLDVEVSTDNPYSFTVEEDITLKAKFGVQGGTGIEDAKSGSFELYPNPVGDKLYVKVNIDLSETVIISMYDVSGKEINNYKGLHHTSDVLELKTSHLTPGMYFLRITDDHKDIRFTGKVIKR